MKTKKNYSKDILYSKLSVTNHYKSKLSNAKLVGTIALFFLFTISISANDFYPSKISPANGEIFSKTTPISIKFEVCLGYDFPAAAGEWYVEISIIDSNGQVVHQQTIQGFDANGPNCFAISDVSSFTPSSDGKYTLQIQTFYAQEINSENDVMISQFEVKSVKDLALVKILSPEPPNEFFIGLDIMFRVLLRNEGDVTISKDDYSIILGIQSSIESEEGNFYTYYPKEEFDLEPKAERVMTIVGKIGDNLSKSDFNKPLNYFILGSINDNNSENNSLIGDPITFFKNPIWPNEFRFGDGLSKTSDNAAINDFVEIMTTDEFNDANLFSLMVFDSIGHQVDSLSLDSFIMGETVDSFTVYTHEYSGDALVQKGAIALSYDSLRFSDYFISWGGSVTAVEGIWKDSTSTDLGVVPTVGNSISLSGQGTEFSSFTWESTTPSPGVLNDSQLVPVEAVSSLPNKYVLHQNYPNPFNPTTTIRYQIPENKKSGLVTLKIYDVLGREIKTLVNEIHSAGNYKINFDASALTSGVYYYKIKSEKYFETKKMLLMK